MGGSPLNRLSWLRTSQNFLNAVIAAPATRWILFNNGQPLIATNTVSQKRALALLATDDVRPLLGIEPYFGQGQYEGEACPLDSSILEAARFHGPRIVFLGLKEADPFTAAALPSSDFEDTQTAIANLQGTPFFSVDIAGVQESLVSDVIQASQPTHPHMALTFVEPRAVMTSLDIVTAAIFAEARSMVDWNGRNKVSIRPWCML